MAKRVQTLLVCDLHIDEVEGEETIVFGLDGSSYEIDVCSEHAEELRESFATFVGAARRAGRSVARTSGRASTPSRRVGRVARVADSGIDVPAVREWARKNGHAVSERGRLSATIIDAYNKA